MNVTVHSAYMGWCITAPLLPARDSLVPRLHPALCQVHYVKRAGRRLGMRLARDLFGGHPSCRIAIQSTKPIVQDISILLQHTMLSRTACAQTEYIHAVILCLTYSSHVKGLLNGKVVKVLDCDPGFSPTSQATGFFSSGYTQHRPVIFMSVVSPSKTKRKAQLKTVQEL